MKLHKQTTYNKSRNRLVHVIRYFADQIFEKLFPDQTDLNTLLGAIFHADYEFDIYSVKNWKFAIENQIINFSTEKLFQQMLSNIPFDTEFKSLQNDLFIFRFDCKGQLVHSYIINRM